MFNQSVSISLGTLLAWLCVVSGALITLLHNFGIVHTDGSVGIELVLVGQMMLVYRFTSRADDERRAFELGKEVGLHSVQ